MTAPVIPARDFLDRFRPAGAPGAAARAGVPADIAREREAELGPVLALLDDVHGECERIIAAAQREADRINGAAQEEAAAIAAEAAHRARTARDEAVREALDEARARAREAGAAAAGQAAQARRLARRRLPELVEKAVALVRAGPEGAGRTGPDRAAVEPPP